MVSLHCVINYDLEKETLLSFKDFPNSSFNDLRLLLRLLPLNYTMIDRAELVAFSVGSYRDVSERKGKIELVTVVGWETRFTLLEASTKHKQKSEREERRNPCVNAFMFAQNEKLSVSHHERFLAVMHATVLPRRLFSRAKKESTKRKLFRFN